MSVSGAIGSMEAAAMRAWALVESTPAADLMRAHPVETTLVLLLAGLFALDGLIGVPEALRAGFMGLSAQSRRRAERAAALRLREISGPRFAVIAAPIENDPTQALSELLARALDTHAPAFLFDRRVASVHPPIALSGAEGAQGAREWSERCDADLVVWGEGGRGRGLMRLYFLTAKARKNNQPVQEIRLNAPSNPEEAQRLSVGIAYIFARTALPCADEPDQYRPDKLEPVLEALDKLANDPPRGLGATFERILREDAAKIAFSIGRRRRDGEALRRASRLRVRLLAEIDKANEPIAWALGRADLGRAQLALGALDEDLRRLDMAIEAFAEAAEILKGEENRAARADILRHLADAHRERARSDGEATHLTAAAKAYRAALKVAPELEPGFVDQVRRGLAGALHGLAELSGDEDALDGAIDVYRASATPRSRALDPVGWSQAQHDLGVALSSLATRRGAATLFEEAIEAFNAALEERTEEGGLAAWLMSMTQLGHASYALGRLEQGRGAFESAISAYESVLAHQGRDDDPIEWARLQNNLGNAHQALGERTEERWRLEAAVKAYRAALSVFSFEEHPFEWAGTQNNLGNALHVLGERSQGVEALKEALEAHEAALKVRTQESSRVDWAATRNNIGLVLTTIGQRLRDPRALKAAVTAYRDALGVFRIAGAVRYAVLAERNLERAEALLRETAQGA